MSVGVLADFSAALSVTFQVATWLIALTILSFFVTFILLVLFPRQLIKPVGWVLCHTLYRLRTHGIDNIPRTGPVLFVCNHVTYIDWLFLIVTSPRPIRFVAWKGWVDNRWMGWFLKAVNVIPVDANTGIRAIKKALKDVSESLDRGEAICIFPEGRLTRSGQMYPFQRGLELILRSCKEPVPIIPTFLSHAWGSIFSYRGGKLFWRTPEQLPYPIGLTFGPSMPSTTLAADVRLKLLELSADAALRESERYRTLHDQFLRIGTKFRFMFRSCFIDPTKTPTSELKYYKAVIGSLSLVRWLHPHLIDQKMIGIWLPTSAGGALTNIATSMLGKTVVNLNYTAGEAVTNSAIQQTGMKTILSSKKFLHRVPLKVDPSIRVILLEDALQEISKFQKLKTSVQVFLFPGWLISRIWGFHRQSNNDCATIIFSSGSTGDPKGVMLSHRNVASNIASFAGHIDIYRYDRFLGVLPFFHSFGFTVLLWAPLQVGASSVLYPDPRQSKEIGELCKIHKCTAFVSTATFLRFYLRKCQDDDFKSLRYLICGAEKLPVALCEEFKAKFGIFPVEGYGCTELTPVVSCNVDDVELNGMKQVRHKPGTIGQPILGVAIRTVSIEDGHPLPIGEEGLLEVKGGNVMMGYLNQPEKTAKVIRDGWYNTGDMAKIDADGFITITGRLSRFAKIAGEMIPLEKIEEEMQAVLGANDRQFAIAAITDEKRGERLIVLYLQTIDKPIKEILKGLSERGLPNLWIPGERDCYVVPEMPVLGTGKLDLRGVKELALELAGRSV
jgi:acyl-[acyl-carrier-protein]-phospholipid O-acyltransferase / long-chain-fatty-acid--[acyl-carrier-protein] ligase